MKPSHLFANEWERRTLCGISKRSKACEPYGMVKTASLHKYPHARCVECFTKAGMEDMLTPEDGPPLALFDVEDQREIVDIELPPFDTMEVAPRRANVRGRDQQPSERR